MKRFWISAATWTLIALFANAIGTSKSVTDSASAQPTYNRYGYSEPQRFESSWTQSVPHFDPLIYVAVLFVIGIVCGGNIVPEWSQRPIMFFGRYQKTLGPGFSWVEPLFHQRLDDVNVWDDTQTLTVENVQTHDNIPISFLLILTTRVHDVEEFTVEVEYGYDAVQRRSLAAAAQVSGQNELDKILHETEEVQENLRKLVQSKIDGWGVTAVAVEIQNISITDESISQAIALKARAKKEGEAELVRAQMQKQIAVALNEAAGTLTEAGRWLKDREVLLEMTRSANNNTVLIPTGLMDLMRTIAPVAASTPAPTSL